MPLVAFSASEAGLSKELLPEWDSGGPTIWFNLMLAPQAQRWLYPLLIWAMLAYGAALTGRRAGWIEVGLSGGFFLALLFSLLFLPLFPLSIAMIVAYGIGLLGLSPFFSLIAYSYAAYRYHRRDAPRAWGLYGLWGATFFGASYGISRTLVDLRAALPQEPPDCYLATASARGWPRIVGSRPVRFGDGQLRPVTRQLRVLKAFELLLVAAVPRAHAQIRTIYDGLGPKLASRMGPLGSTASWLLLLPVALAAEIPLRLLLRDAPGFIDSIYPETSYPETSSVLRGSKLS